MATPPAGQRVLVAGKGNTGPPTKESTVDKQDKEAPNDMDLAADEALITLDEILASATPSAEKVLGWFKANYLASGHKRLGRILVAHAKELGL